MLPLVFAFETRVPPRSPPLNLTHFPDYARNPDERSMSVSIFTSVFSALEWLCNAHVAVIVVLSGWVLQVLEHDIFLFFCFYEERRWVSNPRAHCSWCHVLCATQLWVSRLEILRKSRCPEFLPSRLDFHHAWGWGFHTVHGCIDPMNHRFRAWFIGLVDVWNRLDAGDGNLSSPDTAKLHEPQPTSE